MPYPKVTVVGAGQVGATAAFLLLTKEIADVVLVDVAEGMPQGKALDMMHSRSVEHFGPRVTGSNDYADTEGSDVVVITAGMPRKPGMTREDLLAINGDIMRAVVSNVVELSPDAIIICVTNPLDAMTYLAWSISGLPSERVIGMGGVLDSARFAYAIAEATGAPIDEVNAIVVGAHGEAMVPLPRHTMVGGRALSDILPEGEVQRLCERTVNGGAEVVSLLKTGSAFYAPAASVVSMVEAILGDTGAVMSSCVYLHGEYGIEDVYMSVPVSIGRHGVAGIPLLELDGSEIAALRQSAESIKSALDALAQRD